MNTSLIILPFLLANASHQDDVYKRLRLADRVQVTFQSGNSIIGNLVHISETPDKKVDSVDYANAKRLTLDLSWEYPGLSGTLTVRKSEIKAIRKLTRLDPAAITSLRKVSGDAQAALDRRETERQRYEERRKQAAEEASRQAEERERQARHAEKAAREKARLERESDIYGKYPPPAWGPRRLGEIKIKRLNRIPLTVDEQNFEKQFELWQNADERMKDNKGDSEKKPASKP